MATGLVESIWRGEEGRALQLLARAHHHGGFVDLGQAHVHVEHVGALFLLADALTDDVGEVAGTERCLELLLARRVDALADDGDATAVERGELLGARAGEGMCCLPRLGLMAAKLLGEETDVGGGGSAAASNDTRTVGDYVAHCFCIVFGRDVVDGLTILHAREPGVRLNDKGLVGHGEHALRERADFPRSE